jgi:murein L,D-transpeptidase YcbB/YkuD
MNKSEKTKVSSVTVRSLAQIKTSLSKQPTTRIACGITKSALIMLLLFTLSCRTHRSPIHSRLEPLDSPFLKNKTDRALASMIHMSEYLDDFAISKEEQTLLDDFYKINNNRPVWLEDKRNAQELVEAIELAWMDGLTPDNYGFGVIKENLLKLDSLTNADTNMLAFYAQLDLRLTNAWMQYANDLQNGVVDPAKFSPGWKNIKEPTNLPELLTGALKKHQIPESFDALRPQDDQYNQLRNKLAELIAVQKNGAWPVPGFFKTLEPGDSSTHIIAIRKLLQATGNYDMNNDDSLSPLFDENLESSVIAFQKRHGLKPDGIIGKRTQEEMNKSIDYRIRQIVVNLERMRWLPYLHDEEYLVVNIPEFVLRSYKNNKLKDQMNVVVGNVKNHTPILLNTIKYIVFNPTWNVPPSIVRNEMVAKMKSDSGYLAKNQYVLLKGSYLSRDTVNPADIDWSEITAANFPYHVVQKPGRINALGKVKFLFPNNQNIYLHDTPSKYHFKLYDRDYSHGCVRLQDPERLALHLLEKQMTNQEIRQIIANGKTTTVTLRQKPIIYFTYQTTWVDDAKQINFRKDIYSFDEKMIEMLAEEPALQSSNLR